MPGPDGIQLDMTEFNASLAKFARVAHDEASVFTRQVSESILSQARRRAPIAYGFLKNDSPVGPIEISGSKGLGHEIGFNATYAAAVHERTDLRHTQGQPFYLRDAITKDGPGIMERAVPIMSQRIAGRSGS